MTWTRIAGVAVVLVSFVASTANASMFISEWMYRDEDFPPGGGNGAGEFVEFTNVGNGSIDMTGWSYDDSSRLPGTFDLSSFGVVQPGESVIITEASATEFRTQWGLASSVKVLGGYTNGLGRGDEINLYDDTDGLVDRLTYDDENSMGPRTNEISANPMSLAALGANDANQWIVSSVGDRYGSYAAAHGTVANPGVFTIPEPGTVALLALGMAGWAVGRRRR